MVLAMKLAISPRVTDRTGQNLVSLQPFVMFSS